MSKLLVGVCIALLAAFLGEGWYLGQIQSELMETKAELAAVENNMSTLEDQLLTRNTELLSIKQELEQTQEKLEQAQPRHFDSLEELEAWLARDDTDQMQYCGNEFNCVDFALRLQEHALANGYILSTEVLPVAAHWVNVAVIGDKIYVIEPQDDRVILEKRINGRS